jgi:hypothetical protein
MGKQLRIEGTGRPGIPEALEEASEQLIALRRDKRRVMKEQNEKTKQAMWKVLTLMQEHDIDTHTVKDPDTDEILSFDLETILKITKTGEVESEDGEDDDVTQVSTADSPNGIHPGLIAQAEKAQADAGIVETAEGDVVPSDAPAPKGKRVGKKKADAPKLEVVKDEVVKDEVVKDEVVKDEPATELNGDTPEVA